MKRISLVFKFIFLLLFETISGGSHAKNFGYYEIPIPVDHDVEIIAELYLPSSRLPKALVIAIPGTGGQSDPYFDEMIERVPYQPDDRGGINHALLEQGYATVFFSQRGYRQLRKCVNGNSKFEQVSSYVENCVDKAIRSRVTLFTITDDVGNVFRELSKNPLTRDMHQIALSWSEGTYHIAKLVSNGKISPSSIISIGGPVISLAEVMKFQLSRDYYANVVDIAFDNCKKTELSIFEIFRCSKKQNNLIKYTWMREYIGGDIIKYKDINSRRVYFSNFHKEISQRFSSIDPKSTMDANFKGLHIDIGWSAQYYSQAFNDITPTITNLSNFQGKLFLLYGSEDYLVPIPSFEICSNHTQFSLCKVKIIQGMGHALETNDGAFEKESVKFILNALEESLP